PNTETPYNNIWSVNTYSGTWTFQAYTQAATCQVGWNPTKGALEWGIPTGDVDACDGLTLSQWQQYWQQDVVGEAGAQLKKASGGAKSASRRMSSLGSGPEAAPGSAPQPTVALTTNPISIAPGDS